jgi:deoxyribose-phosphate aldolase
MIDHSILLPTQTEKDLERGSLPEVRAAPEPKVFQAPQAKRLLEGSTFACIAVAFPRPNAPEAAPQAEWDIGHGAQELDMVMNISALKSRMYDYVERDIAGVVEVAGRHDVPVKVILETCLLTDDEKVTACQIAERAGARFVKTSTARPAARQRRHSPDAQSVAEGRGQCPRDDHREGLGLYEAGARRSAPAMRILEFAGPSRKG